MKEFIEKLIGRLEKHSFSIVINWEKGKYLRTDKAIEIVNQLAEEYNNGWIPCSERLPETDDYVLCWYEYKVMQGTRIGEMNQTYGIGYYFNYHNSWGGEVACGVDCKVIAWQPLPPDYQPKGE